MYVNLFKLCIIYENTSYINELSEIIKSFFIRFADNYLGLFFYFLFIKTIDKFKNIG